MMNQAWEDAFQELWNHAAHHRGVREALADPVGPTLSDTLHQWPRTRCADVVGIAAIVDAVLRSAPLVSGAHGVERRWRRCAGQLADVALGDPTLEYRHNRAFWSALASIVAYLASVDAPVPESMWGALLAELAQPMPAPRNTAVSTSGSTSPHSATTSYGRPRKRHSPSSAAQTSAIQIPPHGAPG